VEFAETKFKPDGRMFVRTTLLAVSGPRLVTLSEKVTLLPTFTMGGATSTPRARLATGVAPEQQSGTDVVKLIRQPCVMLPTSLAPSSCTYSDHVPLGLNPLNTESEEPYVPPGAGDENVSPVP
jgi:hypothetical protein